MKETNSKRLNNLFMITHSSVVGPGFKKGSVSGRSLCSEPLCCNYFRDPYFCSWHVSSQFLQILILPSIFPPIPSPYSVGSQIVSVLLLLSQSHTYSLIQVFPTSHQDSISFMVSICCYKGSMSTLKKVWKMAKRRKIYIECNHLIVTIVPSSHVFFSPGTDLL